jgi:isopropylmalate/homocitrate/citramalate synthase
MTPQSVGVPDSRLVLGKHSGRHALAMRCEQLGHKYERRELDEIYRKFVVLADRIKKVQDSHLLELIEDFSKNGGNGKTASVSVSAAAGAASNDSRPAPVAASAVHAPVEKGRPAPANWFGGVPPARADRHNEQEECLWGA